MTERVFVVFDADGNEIDWIDPYRSHEKVDTKARRFRVQNDRFSYFVTVPEGGRFEIRDMEA